ncbi:TetR/AcrR family transcriptional regulator [Phytohabitans kaempferiae]|uniref:TetR/AcrR family transcriptional regulator n=1 Tax=Phytohabitans kaempferiae TaxID=1620943 RepID=A0ABV6MFD2_9ACTN
MSEGVRKPIPDAIELAWRGKAQERPGPKPAFELHDIVDAAVEMADRHGLAEVSLAKVAAVLDCATTALYRYVRSKADLLILMRDRAAAPPDLPAERGQEWPDRLRVIARELFAAYRAHPWMLDVPSTGPSTTPNELTWGEHILRALDDTTLGPVERLRVVTLVTGYTREQARLATVIETAAGQADSPAYGAILRAFVTADRYPAFASILTLGALDGPVAYSDDEFAFGLDRIIDGIAAIDTR